MEEKKLKVIMDMQSIPDGVSLDQFFNIMNNGGIVIWDSSLGGMSPQVLEDGITTRDVRFLTRDEFTEKYENLFQDRDE